MPSVFLSYSHKDEDWKKRLRTHLAVLEAEGLLDVWDAGTPPSARSAGKGTCSRWGDCRDVLSRTGLPGRAPPW
jgi:hypothetical protein